MSEELLSTFNDLARQLRWVDALDILVVAVLVYAAISWLGRAQSRFVVRGLAGTVALYFVAGLLGMHVTLFLFQALLTVAVVALVIIFQEDIRRAFERIAVRARLGFRRAPPPGHHVVQTVTRAAAKLAEQRTGALIVFKGREPLDRHLSGGVVLQGQLSEPLLYSIFDSSSPGHDGGLVIDRGAVDRFGVHLPLSTQEGSAQHGTRHTAARGLAERSDALVVVVSEERGTISVAQSGKLEETSVDELRERLDEFLKSHAPLRRGERSGWLRGALVKLLSVVLAATAWAVIARSQTEVVERTVALPVVYRNVPARWEIDEPDPAEVRVTLSGTAAAFRGLDPAQLAAPVDVSHVEEGSQSLAIDLESIGLPAGVILQRLHPRSVEVAAQQLVEIQLRIVPQTKGRLLRGTTLKQVKVVPEQVAVLVPATARPRFRSLETAAVDLSRLEETTTAERRVLLPDGVQTLDGSPLTVEVTAVLRRPDRPGEAVPGSSAKSAPR